MMKKLLLLLLTLPIFACGINEQLGGPADLQYVMLEKITADQLPKNEDIDKFDNTTNTGYVSLSPDSDPTRMFDYKYQGIKKRITVRNSTDKTTTYIVSIIANQDGVFFITPARDRENGEILKDESCFVIEKPYTLNPPEITLKSNQTCTFDIFAKPNSNSKLRRLDFTKSPNPDEDFFTTSFNDPDAGKYTAVLKVKSNNSLNEYRLNVGFVETLPSKSLSTDTTDITSNKSRSKESGSLVNFGNVKISVDFNGTDTYACDNEDPTDRSCLPFAVVINDKTQSNILFNFSRSFGQTYKISEYSTCKQLEFVKDSEYIKQLDKAYLPCIIFINFAPKMNINYMRKFTFTMPDADNITTHSFVLSGNTDRKTYPAPTISVNSGTDSEDNSTNEYIKFDTIDFSKQTTTDIVGLDNITIKPVQLFVTPQVLKEKLATQEFIFAPDEVEIFNIFSPREVLDIGFVMLMPTFITAVTDKYGADFVNRLSGKSKTPKANTIQTLADEKGLRCFSLNTSVILKNKCYFEVAFVSNIFTDNKTNDNFTRSNLYTYLLDTSVGTIPMYAKYKSPCDKVIDIINPSQVPDYCTTTSNVDKNEKMTEMVTADDKTIKYENTMNIGEVTRTDTTDNTTTYRVYTSPYQEPEKGTYLHTTVELVKPLSTPDKPLFTFVEDKENSNSKCTLDTIDPDTSTENKFKFTATLDKPRCSYLVQFEAPQANESDSDNISDTYFDFIKETTSIIIPSDDPTGTETMSNTTVYYPIYATVMNSIVGIPNNDTDTDNITITFDPSFKNTYSKGSFILKIKKPADSKTVIKFTIDDNFSDSFKIMPRTTCDINYSRAKLTRADFPKSTDYCLLVIRAMPPDEEIVHKNTISFKTTTTTTDSISPDVGTKTYTLKTMGSKSWDIPISPPDNIIRPQ